MYCSKLASPLLYIPEKFIQIRVYLDVFRDIILSYYLTTTRTLTFSNIKYTPDFALASSFFYIVFGQDSGQGMGKKLPQRIQNESVATSFAQKSCPWFLVYFVKNERLECEIKVPLGYYSLSISYVELILEATISRVFLPRCRKWHT